MAVAESPHAVKMCEARGMVKVDKPVYMNALYRGIGNLIMAGLIGALAGIAQRLIVVTS